MAFDIDALIKDVTAGQDTSVSAEVKIAKGEAAEVKSKSGLLAA